MLEKLVKEIEIKSNLMADQFSHLSKLQIKRVVHFLSGMIKMYKDVRRAMYRLTTRLTL